MRYLCRVAYVGWLFHGTNVQPDVKTVEGEMERALRGTVRFLSRTDAGVSAMNNYAVCNTPTDPFAANEIEGVWVTGRVRLKDRPKVFWRWYRYYYPEELEVPEEITSLFVGKHDFSSFSIPEGKDPVREIYRFSAIPLKGFTLFDIVGRSFLRQMVRRMVMGIVLHMKGEMDVKELLKNPRPKAVPPAPPEGLVLMDMGVQPYVPKDERAVRTAREEMERLWKELRLKAYVLSNSRLFYR